MTKTVQDIIDLWPAPKVANFSRDLGITTEHGAAMRRRGSIPVSRWPKVLAASKSRKLRGVTLEALVAAHSEAHS